jgi:glutathione S-transferase
MGDRLYSSWSLRAWLMFEAFNIPHRPVIVDIYSEGLANRLLPTIPARQVPAVRFDDGAVVWDSLAIAEELATRHPKAALWPTGSARRATARSLTAELHAGFANLRAACPMNLQTAYHDTSASDSVLADLDRLHHLVSYSLRQHSGKWMCGEYSIVDAFYAPIAIRIAGYDLPVSDAVKSYVAMHLAHPLLHRWRQMGLAEFTGDLQYPMTYQHRSWDKLLTQGP